MWEQKQLDYVSIFSSISNFAVYIIIVIVLNIETVLKIGPKPSF